MQLLSSPEEMAKTSDRITPRSAGQAWIDLISKKRSYFFSRILLKYSMVLLRPFSTSILGSH